MCGRYVSVSSADRLALQFDVDEVRTEPLPDRWNVAPTLEVYAIIETDGRRRLGTLRWGLVPFWAKSLKGGKAPINARIESINDKRMFTSSFEKRRCLIPADGFYEWQERDGQAKKQPWFIHDPDHEPLAFAGIWGGWRDREAGEGAEPVFSCAIVTTAADGRMRDLHHRMPVMLPQRLWSQWLTADPQEVARLQEMVASLGAPRLDAYAITDRVNNVRNEGEELLEPGTVDAA